MFLSTLTAEEREYWDRHKYLMVTGSDGVQYQLLPSQIFNVIANGVRYCAIPIADRDTDDASMLPLFDRLLAQKLLLECNAPEFKRIANHDSRPLITRLRVQATIRLNDPA